MAVSAQLKCHASSQRTSVHNCRHLSVKSSLFIICHLTLCWEPRSHEFKTVFILLIANSKFKFHGLDKSHRNGRCHRSLKDSDSTIRCKLFLSPGIQYIGRRSTMVNLVKPAHNTVADHSKQVSVSKVRYRIGTALTVTAHHCDQP